MHLHSRSDRSVGYLLFMRRSVCHCRAKPIYWTVSLRPSEKDVDRWLRSAPWRAEDTLPTSQKKSGDCLSRTSRPQNGADVRAYTVLARSLMPSSTSSKPAASGACFLASSRPERQCSTTLGPGAWMAPGRG